MEYLASQWKREPVTFIIEILECWVKANQRILQVSSWTRKTLRKAIYNLSWEQLNTNKCM